MSDLTKFQSDHGEEWNAITSTPAFSAAMSLLNLQKISGIANLTDDQIATNGSLILADLRGHLQHENELFTIGTKPSLEFNPMPETYPDPLSEIQPTSGDNSESSPQQQEQQSPPAKPPRTRRKK